MLVVFGPAEYSSAEYSNAEHSTADRPDDPAARVVVGGSVQGVGYRWSLSREARRLGVHGLGAATGPTGRVEAVAEGPDEAVDALVAW